MSVMSIEDDVVLLELKFPEGTGLWNEIKKRVNAPKPEQVHSGSTRADPAACSRLHADSLSPEGDRLTSKADAADSDLSPLKSLRSDAVACGWFRCAGV